jgi:hypothetical protein
MGRGTIVTGLLLLCTALAAGCNRGPAREALAEAEQAIEAGRAQLEAYAPEELAELRATVRDAQTRLDRGQSTDALRLAQKLPGRIRDALAKSGARKGELDAEWALRSAQLPAVLRGLGLKLSQLEAPNARAAPGLASVADGRARLAELEHAWSQATSTSAGARTAQAVAAAREVATGANALAVRLGFTSAQAAALAGAVAAAGAEPPARAEPPAGAEPPARP